MMMRGLGSEWRRPHSAHQRVDLALWYQMIPWKGEKIMQSYIHDWLKEQGYLWTAVFLLRDLIWGCRFAALQSAGCLPLLQLSLQMQPKHCRFFMLLLLLLSFMLLWPNQSWVHHPYISLFREEGKQAKKEKKEKRNVMYLEIFFPLEKQRAP